MRYPPAICHTPVRSRVYLMVVLLIAIILIASCVYSMPANGHFSFKNSLLLMLSLIASLWLLRDACKPPGGQVQYAQGQWVWQREGLETAGTLRLHLDLQSYLLVSFVDHHHNHNRLQLTKTQWFHLEARHLHHVANSSSWTALRRAVHAQVKSGYETVAV
jgi:hypothetical protein